MKLRWLLALLCFGGCTAASSATTSSGGETVMETSSVAAAEGGTEDGAERADEGEAASDLGDPPPAVSAQTVDGVPPEESAENATPTEPEPPAVVVRPTTILAPARSGRLRLPAVHDVIRDHRDEVTACYQEGLSRDRSLTGVAKVRFLVGPRGRVENAEVYETSLNDGVVEQCILAAMRTWRFPRPRPRGSSVLMTYPYSLATE